MPAFDPEWTVARSLNQLRLNRYDVLS